MNKHLLMDLFNPFLPPLSSSAPRHGGRLYSEAIPVRLISGKWRKYMVVLSGNQLSFYFDCELQMQRLIPLPDYCYDHSPIVVSVLNSVYDGVEYVGHSGLMVMNTPVWGSLHLPNNLYYVHADQLLYIFFKFLRTPW